LFTRLRVHPNFLDVVHIFCEKVGPVEESFNSFFTNVTPQSSLNGQGFGASQNSSYGTFVLVFRTSSILRKTFEEIGYNIKYVAPHGRTFPKDPFSVREVGVYQKYSAETQECQWIFLQASDQLKDRLKRTFERSSHTIPLNQIQMHALIIGSVSEEWRDYLVYLEESFSKLVSFNPQL